MTQMELATVFLFHALNTFGSAAAKLAFVMPRSVLSADQHEKIRLRTYNAPIQIEGYWDCLDVRPLFRVPSCVMFAKKTDRKPPNNTKYKLPVLEWSGVLPSRDISWAAAEPHLQATKATARVIFMGSRSAFSTKPGNAEPGRASAYLSRFHQGATIVPRNFYFVRLTDADGDIDPQRTYWAETDPEQAKEAKEPWKQIAMRGQIEGRFLFLTAISKNVLPFLLVNPPIVAMPVLIKGPKAKLLTAKQLQSDGHRDFGKWIAQAEKHWKKQRGGKGDQTLQEWLDYSGKLTSQDFSAPSLVLYNAAGTDISAVAIERTQFALPFIVDHTLYLAECNSPEEAAYLVAVLNSAGVNAHIKPFQSMGLQGERHVHKKVLELPIPIYDDTKAPHRDLAIMGLLAQQQAAEFASTNALPTSLAARRRALRQACGDILAKIDKAVVSLLASS